MHALGGYRLQGKTPEAASIMKRHAHELQDAGASLLVLEMVPAALAGELTAELTHCPTIGIGAGNGTAGQVLVLHDMLGANLGKMPKFVRNFMADLPGPSGQHGIRQAMQAYVEAVKCGSFPDNSQHAW
ncbi:3-methyl-2-oxobutanoate hydroxymethyltransferase [mine drainage metagenome]|uniref:3-methyl-2-oxobutanoate hydroxymethyltransferase n=1 Tax=mine drainage metagenome TaxID=410659 RepID=A0A1J5PJI5_9ZZZZ